MNEKVECTQGTSSRKSLNRNRIREKIPSSDTSSLKTTPKTHRVETFIKNFINFFDECTWTYLFTFIAVTYLTITFVFAFLYWVNEIFYHEYVFHDLPSDDDSSTQSKDHGKDHHGHHHHMKHCIKNVHEEESYTSFIDPDAQ